MNEWEFTGDVNSWFNELLARTPIPPFHRSKVEQTGSGSRKRRDLTLLDKSKRALITGEIKLPYKADGNSPYITKVVKDARKKARRAKARFFFTWNVNECVLWETEPADPSKLGQDYKSWQVAHIHNEAQLEHRSTEEEIKDWLVKFLYAVAQILEGTAKIGRKPPDEKFIDALESSLKMPVQFSYDELEERYRKKRERARIDTWMRDDQGWTIYDDPNGIRENLERASRFACYALINKLVFHEALLKRYGRRLDKLQVPGHIDTGDQLWAHLEKYFKDAIEVTGDYETVFGEDHRSIGNRIPFFSDQAVPHLRALIEHIHDFDFSRLDHEVIGTMFERLLSPEERHKFGQYYTRVEIVDLINSFCIRRGDEKIMDPACGGGTFLVRAYARMKVLMPDQPHGEILRNIFGVDIADFATRLATINLAVRDLIDDENYPQIVRSDFFDIQTGKVLTTLPKKIISRGSGKSQRREVEVPSLDAVIGNPPYIRQEGIGKSRKPRYRNLIKQESNVVLSGRSDIHCYFWPHAATFLRQDGYLCLLTSSQWLDVEYGFKLQKWILNNFEIKAIFESIDEPWFVGARVATTVTILKRQNNEAARMKNNVRFVQLRRPMAEILANDGSITGAMAAVDEFRDEILSLNENTVNERYRARLVSQQELWNTGVQLGVIMGKTDRNYYGGKWGIHLRAPDLWFELLDTFSRGIVPLSSIAEVRFGVKSGKDCFFFPKDCSDECLDRCSDPGEFEVEYGVKRKDVQDGRVRLVRCGEGYSMIKPLESKYLEPEVHSLMEIDGFVALPENCRHMILLIGESKSKIIGKYAAAYIKWGESQRWHLGSTCASRQSKTREWYDLTGHRVGQMFWPKTQKYKHVVALNKYNLLCNCNLYDVFTGAHIDPMLLAGILNSSLVILSKAQFGRYAGTEGTLKTEIVDVNMMLIPDPNIGDNAAKRRVIETYKILMRRQPLQLLSERRLREAAYKERNLLEELENLSAESELEQVDRHDLDHAVLELIGVKQRKTRIQLLNALYTALGEMSERHRSQEEKANFYKRLSARRGRLKPADVAAQIFEDIQATETWLLQQYDPDILNKNKLFDSYDIPDAGEPRQTSDMFAGSGLAFVRGKKQNVGHVKTKHKSQDDLIVVLVEEGYRGLLRVPHTATECRKILKEFSGFIERRNRKLHELVAERTSDEDLQEKILDVLKTLIQG